jgi:hypothetical protein
VPDQVDWISLQSIPVFLPVSAINDVEALLALIDPFFDER